MPKQLHSIFCVVALILTGCAGAIVDDGATDPNGAQLPVTQTYGASVGEDDKVLAESLGLLIPQIMQRYSTPGLNIALVRDGTLLWEAGFGYADFESKTPMTPESVFHSGSMAKAYTAVSVMQLVDQGILSLDDTAGDHLPFDLKNPYSDEPVTIFQLMTHTSGLGTQISAVATDEASARTLEESVIHMLSRDFDAALGGGVLPLWIAAPGERWNYSNLGMGILSLIVERSNPEGLSFTDYVQRNIMDALRMRSAQFPPTQLEVSLRDDIRDKLTTGYVNHGTYIYPSPEMTIEQLGAGGFLAAPESQSRLISAILGGGELDGVRILSPEATADMITPQLPGEPADGAGQGLVWRLILENGRVSQFFHPGGHPLGWINWQVGWPEHEVSLVVATNHWALNRRAGDLEAVVDFVDNYLAGERAENDSADPDWGWKLSYLAGARFIELANGFFNPRPPVTPETVKGMAARQATDDDTWNADGFIAGAEAMMNIELNPEGIAAFAASDAFPLSQDEVARGFSILESTSDTRLMPTYLLVPATK